MGLILLEKFLLACISKTDLYTNAIPSKAKNPTKFGQDDRKNQQAVIKYFLITELLSNS